LHRDGAAAPLEQLSDITWHRHGRLSPEYLFQYIMFKVHVAPASTVRLPRGLGARHSDVDRAPAHTGYALHVATFETKAAQRKATANCHGLYDLSKQRLNDRKHSHEHTASHAHGLDAGGSFFSRRCPL
jgi:hypothetical protein